MKLAISTKEKNLNSPVEGRFGRSPSFIIYDTESGEYESIDNISSDESLHGAGIKTAELIANKEVDVVITGHCGPNAFQTLQAAGIKVILWDNGTVLDGVNKFKADELKPREQPDVRGHW